MEYGYVNTTADPFNMPKFEDLLKLVEEIKAVQPKEDVFLIVVPKGAKVFYSLPYEMPIVMESMGPMDLWLRFDTKKPMMSSNETERIDADGERTKKEIGEQTTG